jgi:predicted O-linked N-acetylglucosamine transferase (SPINDLY family)
MGETFAGRVAASLLTAVGMPELIARNVDEYAEVALTLANDRARLAELRAKLARQRETAPLFDTVRYTRNLEHAFKTMVEIARSGEPPRPFAIEDRPSA